MYIQKTTKAPAGDGRRRAPAGDGPGPPPADRPPAANPVPRGMMPADSILVRLDGGGEGGWGDGGGGGGRGGSCTLQDLLDCTAAGELYARCAALLGPRP